MAVSVSFFFFFFSAEDVLRFRLIIHRLCKVDNLNDDDDDEALTRDLVRELCFSFQVLIFVENFFSFRMDVFFQPFMGLDRFLSVLHNVRPFCFFFFLFDASLNGIHMASTSQGQSSIPS